MTRNEMMAKAGELLLESKIALLATVDEQGYPRMRWMTPVILSSKEAVVYAVTSPAFPKVNQMIKYPQVEWLIQDKPLLNIVNLRGKIYVIDNPSLRKEVMESLDPNLNTFWKQVQDRTDFVVLETIVEEGIFFRPVYAEKERVAFA